MSIGKVVSRFVGFIDAICPEQDEVFIRMVDTQKKELQVVLIRSEIESLISPEECNHFVEGRIFHWTVWRDEDGEDIHTWEWDKRVYSREELDAAGVWAEEINMFFDIEGEKLWAS